MLIGMPGCGKSSIGLELARLTGRPLYDTDDMVIAAAGLSIPAIFDQYGEVTFRELEQRAVALAAESQGSIIATGGGTVLKAENCRLLSESGRFYFIERSLDKLHIGGRPLSVNLAALYKERLPIYSRLAHTIIHNDGTITQAAESVRKAHQEAKQGVTPC